MEKFMNIWNSSFFGKLCVGMEPAHFVASSKGINLLKDSNNSTCIFTAKIRHTIHRPPTGTRNTETDAKRVGVLQKESNEQVLIATYL